MVKTLNAPQIATSDKMVVIPRNKTPILFLKNEALGKFLNQTF